MAKKHNKKRIKSEQDSSWKDILEAYFQEFMTFFYPDMAKKIDWSHGYISLEQELRSITSDATEGKKFVDKLFQVKSLDGEEKEILIEIDIQGQKEDTFPLRLFQYYYCLFDLRKKPIVILAILTDSNKTWHPKHYQAEVWDLSILTFNFQSCKLLDYKSKKQELEESNNPFATVVLSHLAFMETKTDSGARLGIKFWLTRRLYEKGYSRDYVINLFKVIDWVLVLPKDLALEYKEKVHKLEEAKKVSYITSIEQLGREEGLQQGLQQGRAEGRHEEALIIARNLLADGISPKAVQRLTGLTQRDVMSLHLN